MSINLNDVLVSIGFVVRKYTNLKEDVDLETFIDKYINEKGLNEHNNIKFSFDEVISDINLLKIVEKSWIGKNALFFAKCIDMLTEKHKNTFNLFDELISS